MGRHSRHQFRVERARGMLAAGKTLDEVAAEMHMSRKAVQIMVERGCSEKVARAAIEDTEPDDTTPGCVRCGLRGPHECLKGDAQARRGEAEGSRYSPVRRAAE